MGELGMTKTVFSSWLGTHLDGKLAAGVVAEDGAAQVEDFPMVEEEEKPPTQRQQQLEASVNQTLAV